MSCICCRKPNGAVAIQSTASAGTRGAGRTRTDDGGAASAPESSVMADRGGFENDKQAVAKWRLQHSPAAAAGSEEAITNRTPKSEQMHHQKQQSGSRAGSGHERSSGESSSSRFDLGVDVTNQPVLLSTRAVQAWQQKKSANSPQHSQRESKRQQEFAASPSRSSRHYQPKSPPKSSPKDNFMMEEAFEPVACSVTPVVTPNATSHDWDSYSTDFQIPQSCKSTDGSAAHNTVNIPIIDGHQKSGDRQTPMDFYHQDNNATIPMSVDTGRKKKFKKRAKPESDSKRRHDHEVLSDQLMRDTLTTNMSMEHETAESDHESRKKKCVYLQVDKSPRTYLSHPLSPSSTLGESETVSSAYYHDDDMLSDVASSLADSETRERYILACRLLRARMMQENPPPILQMERELLEDLMYRFQSSTTAGSSVAYEMLSQMLQAASEPSLPILPPPPQKPDNQHSTKEQSLNDTTISEDSCTSVASIREEDEGFNTVLKTTKSKKNKSRPYGKHSKLMPALEEEDDEKKLDSPSHLQDDSSSKAASPPLALVRYDGWNFPVLMIDQYPFKILGLDRDTPQHTRVLTPALMEALRGFFPYAVSEDNFWLKFSMVRDGASLRSLLSKVKMSKTTIISIETREGDVFGCFCSTPWRDYGHKKWFGSGESFLWRLKKSRFMTMSEREAENQRDGSEHDNHHNEMEVYPFAAIDDLVQYCTNETLAVGGGSWKTMMCPFAGEPTGIGILIDGDLEGGETNACATFLNPRLCGRASSNNEFTISNVEVWTTTPCSSLEEAEKMEEQMYFIEQQRQK